MATTCGRAAGMATLAVLVACFIGCGPSGDGGLGDDDSDGGSGHGDGGHPGHDGGGPNDGPYDDFPAAPVVDGTAPGDSSDLFSDPGSDSGGPCLIDPELGALIPQNWLRLRVHFEPGNGQNLFEIRFHVENQNNDLVVYTSNTTWTMPKPMWESLAYHSYDLPLTISVRGAELNGSTLAGPPSLGSTGTVMIAGSAADGTIVYWTTSGGSALKGFHIGDESVQEVLRPAQASTSCIGCHTSTPDGLYTGFTAAGADPDDDTMFVGLRSVDGAAGLPPYLSTSGKNLLSRIWQMAPAFSPGHFADGDRVALSMYNGTDIIWTDLEATSETMGTGWGILQRGGDPLYPAMVNFSRDGTRFAYCSTPNPVVSGVQTSDCDIHTVPYNSRAGGASTPLPGASDSQYSEYYPTFSPDDDLIAFNRIAPTDDTYAHPDAELYVIGSSGGEPVRLAANDPPACTGKTSPGLTNSWPKWSPSVSYGLGKTYYWLTFSSTRYQDLVPQLFVTALVVDETGVITTYPALYLWNQPPDEGNHTPAWDTFQIPPIP